MVQCLKKQNGMLFILILGMKNKVASNLEKTVENRHIQDLIQEIRVPTEIVTEIKDNKKREVERKIFPGYVLVKMVLTDESWYVVRNIRGCTGFVGPSSKPIPLSDEEIARLGVEKKRGCRFPTALAILLTLLMVRLTDLPVLLKKLTSRKTVSA